MSFCTVTGPNRSSSGMRVQLLKEWVSGTFQPNGDSRSKQVGSIKKKIYEHRDSASHRQAAEIGQEASGDKLKQ